MCVVRCPYVLFKMSVVCCCCLVRVCLLMFWFVCFWLFASDLMFGVVYVGVLFLCASCYLFICVCMFV